MHYKKLLVTALAVLTLTGCNDTVGGGSSHTEVGMYPSTETHIEGTTGISLDTETSESTPFSGVLEALIFDFRGQSYTVPAWDGKTAYVDLKGDPLTDKEKTSTDVYEYYSELDGLGRCGNCNACVGIEIMPTEKRGAIGHVRPSGWHTIKYPEVISDLYLYNRCHLIGYQIAGENDNVKNLITGTRFLNIDGMLWLENEVADYVESNNGHVFYDVTPIYVGDELVCRGLVILAYSVDDNGRSIDEFVYCYNVQPGIEINYATGDSKLCNTSWETEETTEIAEPVDTGKEESIIIEPVSDEDILEWASSGADFFIVNMNTNKFHRYNCSYVNTMKEKYVTTALKADLEENGYSPCSRCANK